MQFNTHITFDIYEQNSLVENCGTAKLLAFSIPSKQFILTIKLQLKNHHAVSLGVQIHTSAHATWALFGMFVLFYTSFIIFRIFITMNLCLCYFTQVFLCSAEMTLLLMLNLFWIYSKRRSSFFMEACPCFKLYALDQVCIDLRSSSLHGYATVMHSCGLRYKRILLKGKFATSFLCIFRRC